MIWILIVNDGIGGLYWGMGVLKRSMGCLMIDGRRVCKRGNVGVE